MCKLLSIYFDLIYFRVPSLKTKLKYTQKDFPSHIQTAATTTTTKKKHEKKSFFQIINTFLPQRKANAATAKLTLAALLAHAGVRQYNYF